MEQNLISKFDIRNLEQVQQIKRNAQDKHKHIRKEEEEEEEEEEEKKKKKKGPSWWWQRAVSSEQRGT